MNRLPTLEEAFQAARSQGRAALMPYFTIGYPDLLTSFAIVQGIAQAGADIIELGIPFSDPLADGPTIQHSTQVALQNGVTLETCLTFVRQLRQSGVTVPLLLMGYYNPIFSFGEERFVHLASECGAQGLIIPDLPPEEAGGLRQACQHLGLAMIHLIAPTTPPERIRSIAEHTSGFLYVVSVTGVTGAREELPPELVEFIQQVRAVTELPLALGFGISRPQQAVMYGRWVDGVIVGSALIEFVRRSENPIQAATAFVREFRTALESIFSAKKA
ncbi:MAG: tryptophan synthase subunit alpha [Anaerolineales bacterium]|nr:tryptophan synthase subunit alpha [Anaerolineales bacterium]MCS7246706.1 tryptophan synthase subunit alpha [Anaerolineales bacterium]MDW8160516.1 tryptophan synthase subunit alpha [Anaerolineales bacterium]MDW8446525.1 tryptophan synthase subunit alpha [Anaerolineales bacterium]